MSQTQHVPVIVIGGGQAGLSMSYFLKQAGLQHVVLERHRAGYAWRERRWDSFCLVTPNWQCDLPGLSYREYGGSDPDGFMRKHEILDYLQSYLHLLNPPLREGVEVQSITRDQHGFRVRTSSGEYTADQVVIAVGSYHVPKIPAMADRLPSHVQQLHASEYRNPHGVAAGAVLVVGTGQSGCQIAEDLHLAGRKVHLCTGSAPRVARRYRGRDVVSWLADMGYYDMPVQDHPLKQGVRAKANHYVTGRDGGRDIDLRRFAREGMVLHGRLRDVEGGTLHLGDDLERNLDSADATSESIKRSIDAHIAKLGLEVPEEAPYVPCWRPGDVVRELDLAREGIGCVIWSMGYRSDFSFVELQVFDEHGYPRHERGVTPAEGLFFLGLPWLHTWGSGRFSGVKRDAAYLLERIVALRLTRERVARADAAASTVARPSPLESSASDHLPRL